MLKQYRQKQAERQEQQRKAQEMQQQAAEQTKLSNDNDLTDEAAGMLERYRKKQRDRGRDGLEY